MKTKRTLILTGLITAMFLSVIAGQAQTVVQISAGGTDSLFLKSDGSLWGMGQDAYGQLGIGIYLTNTPPGTNRPVQIVPSGVTTIAAGGADTLFVRNDSSLWGAGYNIFGELGFGVDNTNFPYGTNRPVLIVSNGVTSASAGSGYVLFIKNDGSLWDIGNNADGQLGNGVPSTNNPSGTNRPVMIVTNDVTAVSAGGGQTLFLKSDGSLWVMGYNYYGQLGDGEFGTNSPFGTNQPVQIVSNSVVAISAGTDHSLFLKSDGSLWGMGANEVGELGDGGTNNVDVPELIVSNSVIAIAAGDGHSLFIKNDGSLWAMGYNYFGQLGDGEYDTTGLRGTNEPVMIEDGGVTAISAAADSSLFLKSDGSLWGMGLNEYGELGDLTFNNTNRPVQILARGTAGVGQLSIQILSGGNVQLSFVGIAGMSYAEDRSFSLSPLDWVPQATNLAGVGGLLLFTNTPDLSADIFWRIRPVP